MRLAEMDFINTNMLNAIDGLYLAPHPRFVECDELFLKRGNDISEGVCLGKL